MKSYPSRIIPKFMERFPNSLYPFKRFHFFQIVMYAVMTPVDHKISCIENYDKCNYCYIIETHTSSRYYI